MFSRISLFLFGVLLALGLPRTAVEAATFTHLSSHVVVLDGYIELGDCNRWKEAVGPSADTVVLNSPGGRIGQGHCISRLIAARGMKTFVQGKCASMCFVLFAAGTTRQACKNAKIGVHRPSDPATLQESSDPTNLQAIVEHTARYGVPRAIQERISGTPAKEMYWLNDADLASMNVKQC